MCYVQAAAFVVSALGQVYNYQVQQTNAQAQAQSDEVRYHLTRQAATSSALRQIGSLRTRELERSQIASQEISRIREEAERAGAQARVLAAESGVAGQSIASLLSDFEQQEREAVAEALEEEKFRKASLLLQEEAIIERAENQIQSGIPFPAVEPSVLQPILGIAGAGVTFADALQDEDKE